MKALVLAGGYPQIELIENLKRRGIFTILADYYEHPVARDHADRFYRISTLDVPAITELAKSEQVDFLITVCTDQALLTVAKVSEELGLPCYIDYETALNVTNKLYMKKKFAENNIPTSAFTVSRKGEAIDISGLRYPLIVKPADCNSSKGVKKARNEEEFKKAFEDAERFSRTDTVVVEEYVAGKELSIDVYVENGKVHVLDITSSEKINDEEKFVIIRSWHPADISDGIKTKISDVVQKIADTFGIRNAPMLVQMITDGANVYVLEFSARTGGGVKFRTIELQSGMNVIDMVVDLTLGKTPHVDMHISPYKYMLDEYIYCSPGVFDHIEGFDELVDSGELLEGYIFRWKDSKFDKVESSGDRIAGFTIVADSMEELSRKHELVNGTIKVVSVDNTDIMRHDLLLPVKY